MVENWLKNLRSNSTRSVYLSGLKDFITTVVGGDNFEKDVESYIQKLEEGHSPVEDLLIYASSLTERNKPPKTANVYIHSVLNFLEFKIDFELSKKQKKQLRNRMPNGKRARTIEDDLTTERLRKILTHCGTKGKSLFLLLSSSGIRIGEALQIEVSDIDFDSKPVKVNVRGEYTKTKEPRCSFISKETERVLLEWLKERESYIKTSVGRGRGLGIEKSVEDERVFPFSSFTARSMWNNAVKKARLENHDKGTGRMTLHIHQLRKYFNSQLKKGVPREIVEALMGHEEGLSSAYRRYSIEELKDYYLKGEQHLYVFVPKEISQVATQFTDGLLKAQVLINGLTAENMTLKKKVENLEGAVEKVTEMFQKDVERVRKEFNERLNDFFADQEAKMSDAAEEEMLPVSKEKKTKN